MNACREIIDTCTRIIASSPEAFPNRLPCSSSAAP